MKSLSYGARGTQVQLLQAALKRAGYDKLKIDGIFGSATETAVKDFQSRNHLRSDGIVGPDTWRALNPYLVGYETVIVQQGDTYWLIAQRFGTSVNAISAANPEYDPTNLPIGAKLVVPLSFPAVFDEISYTSQVMSLIADALKARYPFIRVGSAGESVLGKPLYTFEVGTGDRQVFFNASHHANEWITTPLLLRFLEQLCQAYIHNECIGGRSAAELLEYATLYMIPMVNPDGVDLVTGYIPPNSELYDTAKAMNTMNLPFPDGWKANINGVDLNLQYPARWEEAKEIKFAEGYTQPGPRDYVGQAPLDQPESIAVAEYTQSHDFSLILAYHTQGEVIYWKFLDYLPQDSLRIGMVFSNLSGYSLELTPLRSSFAGYKDWFIQQWNRPGYTVEAGLGVAPLPISDLDGIYKDNLGIFVYAMGLGTGTDCSNN